MHNNGLKRGFFAALGFGFALLPVVLFLLARPATGTEAMMKSLPAYEKYRCALCHTSPAPTTEDAALNAFGSDFQTNSSLWDERLALMNSDGDRCANGAEIGDRDGNGVFDDGGNRPRESSNPGDPADCTAPITEETWGIIKDIFKSELEEYIIQEPEWPFYTAYFTP